MTILNSTGQLLQQLIQLPSVTPNDSGCQPLIATRLAASGFINETMPFATVSNLWSRRGQQSPLFCFAGHTDVVPAGKLQAWQHDPFSAILEGERLYGRGAADMKGGIAAFITAVERFVSHHPHHRGSIALLLTSDEEGDAVNGTVKVIERLQQRGEAIHWCLIGEPSSQQQIADTIKNGRRGSLTGQLQVHGVQGHVAYPHLAENPIHNALAALAELIATEWDQGSPEFPPTTLQISNIHAGTGASNVIPGELEVQFNLRFSTALNQALITSRVTDLLNRHSLRYTLNWNLSGNPFLTSGGELLAAAKESVAEICGFTPVVNTSGGTSDGRFIAPTGAQVIELGLLNTTIHKVNEQVKLGDVDKLSIIYEKILEKLLL
ncbi:MAG: succinyl-diaminopimelate desuccinylase [Gammaproteobacteria bacterium]|nr:succinyl-diaminopimelate desuccinylase [Gammaproteobacteria bacterium]